MKRLLVLLLIVSPAFVVSCWNRGVGDPLSIPYVRGVLADTVSAPYTLIRDAGMDGKNGTIAIIGPFEDAFYYAEELLSCDYFDNVDGRKDSDGLPDFAGETVAVISDNANAPYSGYLRNGNENFLKEVNVKNFISAIDTVCSANQFEVNNSLRKQSSKVIILGSSYASAFGYSDIMELYNVAKPDIEVISPVHSLIRYAVARHGTDAELAVWTNESILGAGVYSIVFEQLSKEYPSLEYTAFCPTSKLGYRERILSFLRLYKASGQENQISAVLVDDIPLRADSLNVTLEKMIAERDDSLRIYANFISPKFEFIDPGQAVASDCIHYLRASNSFTHKVAYPNVLLYATSPVLGLSSSDYTSDGDYTDSFKYGRADNADKNSYVLTYCPWTSLDNSQKLWLEKFAVKTFGNYVSN